MPIEFTFDQAKCTGCQACVLACTIENKLDYARSWRRVHTFNERNIPNLPVQHLSLACNHCETPACLLACPANAYSRDDSTGFVVLEADKCIGCKYCAWACPFGAPQFNPKSGVIEKCTFCDVRQAEGKPPACVVSCPTGALYIAGRTNRKDHDRVAGFPESDLGPAITIASAASERSAPDSSIPSPHKTNSATNLERDPWQALSSEWPLVAFSYLTTLLIALFASVVVGGRLHSPLPLAAVAASAAVIGTVHLGRKSRAWRAVMNPASSWLSREILSFTLFFLLGAGYLAFDPGSQIVGAIATVFGLATLVSIDRVYAKLPLISPSRFHSSGAVLTGFFLFGALLSNPLLAGAAATAKLVLYLRRKEIFRKTDNAVRPLMSALRLLSGFVAPTVTWASWESRAHSVVIVAILIGELIDRIEFYLELEVVSPEQQMALDLRQALSVRRT